MHEINHLIDELVIAEKRDQFVLNLTANENITSKCASKYAGSIWSNRYHLGTLNDYEKSKEAVDKGGLVFRGLPEIYSLEKHAVISAHSLFNGSKLETRYLSGIHAVISNLAILMEQGNLVMSFDPKDGGHFATKNLVQYLGGKSKFLPFNTKKQEIDISRLRYQLSTEKPDIILIDHGVTLFPLNISELREVCGKDTIIIYDASHTLGLIAGKVFPDPLDNGSDLVQGNTHKSFPGPHKALAYWSDAKFDVIKDGLDCAFISSQNTHQAIALYLSLLEMSFYATVYAEHMIKNAQIFAKELVKNGLDVMSFDKGFTETNIILVRLPSISVSKRLCILLQKYNISSNSRVIFGIPTLRLGVQEITRRGMGKKELQIIAKIFKEALDQVNMNNEIISLSILKKVEELMNSFQSIRFSFDNKLAKIQEKDYA